VRPRGGGRLVAARFQVAGQVAHQRRPVRGVVGRQRAQFPLGEGREPRVVPQHVQQAAQPQVRQPVERAPVGVPDRRVGDLPGVEERPAHAAQPVPGAPAYGRARDSHRGPDPDDGDKRPGGHPRRQPPEHAVDVSVGEIRRQRQERRHPHVVQRAHQRRNADVAAGTGDRLGHVEHGRLRRQPGPGFRYPGHRRHQPPPRHRHAHRLRARRGDRGRQLRLRDDRPDQHAVGLPLDRLPPRGLQLGELRVDDPRVHRLGDRDERHLALEHDQRQTAFRRRRDERAGQRAHIALPQLDRQPGDPRPGQPGHVPGQQRGGRRQRDPRRQHELAAPQQPPHVRHLGGVHPADGGVEPVRGGHDDGLAGQDDVEREHLAQGQWHRHRPYIM
jgi:hypothetical protein